MVQTSTKRIAFEEYLTYDDGTANRYEFCDGALFLMTPPTGEHGAIAGLRLIPLYLEIQRLGLDWRVRADKSAAPQTLRTCHP
jgi:Uma2 family endonuclease